MPARSARLALVAALLAPAVLSAQQLVSRDEPLAGLGVLGGAVTSERAPSVVVRSVGVRRPRFTTATDPVPEASSCLLLGAGLVALGAALRLRR